MPLHGVNALDGQFRFGNGSDARDIFGEQGPEGLELVMIEEERDHVEVGVDMSDVVTAWKSLWKIHPIHASAVVTNVIELAATGTSPPY